MSVVYMMVGIPGSGKSTWAKQNQTKYNYTVYSSDEWRKILFNDETDQSHNESVFKRMNFEAIKTLNSGSNICYDATNVTRKTRRMFLSEVDKRLHKCVAVVFFTDADTCKKRNSARSRVVPDFVIDRMLTQFEFPLLNEGFSKIIRADEIQINSKTWINAVDMMTGYDQNNPHHSLPLDQHCKKCEDYILSKNSERLITEELCFASLLHDFGKLFTQTYDHEKNYMHYFGHASSGAYRLMSFKFPEWINTYLVGTYICYHMEPFYISTASFTKQSEHIELFGELWQDIQLIHEGDLYAK